MQTCKYLIWIKWKNRFRCWDLGSELLDVLQRLDGVWHGTNKRCFSPSLWDLPHVTSFHPSDVRQTGYKAQEMQGLCDPARITPVTLTTTPPDTHTHKINDSNKLTTHHLHSPRMESDNRNGTQTKWRVTPKARLDRAIWKIWDLKMAVKRGGVSELRFFQDTHTHHHQHTTSNILQRALSFRCLPTVCAFILFLPSCFKTYRTSSASALFAFGIGYFETLLWCDKHANCVLNNSTEWWGRSVFNVFSASLSLAISVDVLQWERHMARTIRSNQDSALLYVTSNVAPALKHTHCFF